jgi:hypothetical protein
VLVALVAEGVALVLLAVLVLGLLRSHALILKALHDLGAGLDLEKDAAREQPARGAGAAGPVPVELETGVVPAVRSGSTTVEDIVGTDLHGATTRVRLSEPGRTMLAFLTSGCSVCLTFWEAFREGVEVPGAGRLVVVAKGPTEESPSALATLAGDTPVVVSSAAWVDHDIPGSPYFLYVENGAVTGEGSATTWPQVRDLMQQGLDETAAARAARRPQEDGVPIVDRGERDSLSRVDAELRRAGIGPGHPSLFVSSDGGSATDGPTAG